MVMLNNNFAQGLTCSILEVKNARDLAENIHYRASLTIFVSPNIFQIICHYMNTNVQIAARSASLS